MKSYRMSAAVGSEEPTSIVGYTERIVAQRGALVMISAPGRLTRERCAVAFECAGRVRRANSHAIKVKWAVVRTDDLVHMCSREKLLAMAGRSGILRRAES
jgi:hypothetical protein